MSNSKENTEKIYGEKPAAVDPELQKRINERRRQHAKRRRRARARTLLLAAVVFVMFVVICGKDIVRLKAENVALKRQQAKLEERRDDLKEELKSTGKQEYIRDQAHRQLRLLNPGEILFTFDDDKNGGGK